MYAVQAGDDAMITNAVEIKQRAMVRAGQRLIEGKKTGQIKTQADNSKASAKASISSIGLSHHESAKYQQLARVPTKDFEHAIEVVKKRDPVLTEAAVKVIG